MNKKSAENYLYNQVPLRILSFLSIHPDTDFSAKEVSQNTQASKGATHQTLQRLLSLNILSREQKGNLYIYKLNQHNPALRQFKIFETVLKIQTLIQQIRQYCYQIILFGSCANGANSDESDIDLFIKADNRKTVQRIINRCKRKGLYIKEALYEPMELIRAQREDKVFFEQIKKGITLWEGKPERETIQS